MTDRPPDWHRRLRELERRADVRDTDITRLWQGLPQATELRGHATPMIVPTTTTPVPLGIVVPSGFGTDAYCTRWNETFPMIVKTAYNVSGDEFGWAWRTARNSYNAGWIVTVYGKFTNSGGFILVFCTTLGAEHLSNAAGTISYGLYPAAAPWPSGFTADSAGLTDWLTGRTVTLTTAAHNQRCLPGTIEITWYTP